MKNHKKDPCKKCDKTFPYESILEKHIKNVNEQLKLYCYFFNNQKECPHDQECVLLYKHVSM